MGLINNIFRWFILDRMRTMETFMSFPQQVQDKVLKDNLLGANQTEYAKKYQFDSITNIDQFQQKVPIVQYADIRQDVERMMNGESNILWNGEVNWYAKSSGTTDDKSKYIPITKESLQNSHFKAGKDVYAMFYNLMPEANLVDGKTLGIGGSHQIHQLNNNCYIGDLSAVLLQNLPIFFQAKRVPDLEIALMDNWEEKIDRMALSVMNEDITNILGVPTWTIVLIKRIFELTGKSDLSEIWPNLQLYIHGGVSFKPYYTLFEGLISKKDMFYLETYNASEGFFGMQDSVTSKEMLLMLDYGTFYEFITLDDLEKEKPRCYLLEEVELNVHYAVIITTNGGLWRYNLGDTVKFTSKDPYKIIVSGRTKHYINAFGEELMVDNADEAIRLASHATSSQITDYTVAPIFFNEHHNGGHEWLIEFENEPSDKAMFEKILDDSLKSINTDYEAKRHKDIALAKPTIHYAPKGTFSNWLKSKQKLGGQHKIPRLANHRQHLEDVFSIM